MTFAYTILYVPDVEKTIAFYEAAFGCTRRFVTPGNTYGELETGGTTLSFAALDFAANNLPDGFQPADPAAKPFAIEIGFATTDVQAAVDKALAAGATLLAGAKEKPWGQTVAYVRDLNGFLVELCTPMG